MTRPGRGTDALVVLGGYLLLGVLCGLVWWAVVDPATFTKAADGSTMDEVQVGRRFEGDGWYAVIALVAGLVAGAGLTWWRTRDPRVTTALVVVGSALAGVVMARVGAALGPGDVEAALAAAAVGDRVPVPLEVTAPANFLVLPIASLVGALVVLWSTPDPRPLHRPDDGTGERTPPGEAAGRVTW